MPAAQTAFASAEASARGGGCERHRPEDTVLYQTLQAHWRTFLAEVGGESGPELPRFVIEEVDAFLKCGVAETCTSADAGPVSVILGANAAAVAVAIGDLRVALITNDAWKDGLASSIRAAVGWAETTSASALTIVLGDQPLLTVSHVTTLRDAWLAGADLVASRFAGVLGAPAVFDRSRWPELAKLEGDQGAGPFLRTEDVVAVDWAGGAVDVDTEGDLLVLAARGDVDAHALLR